MPATRGDLITQAKGFADFENDSNISPTLWAAWALREMRYVWRFLSRINRDHFTAGPTSFTLTNPTDSFDLTTLTPVFWRARWVDYQASSGPRGWAPIQRWSFKHKQTTDRRWRQLGNSLKVTPLEEAAGTYRVWYIPEPTAFVDDNSQINLALSMYDDMIALRMAIRGRRRQQKEHAELTQELLEVTNEAKATAADRDGSPQERVTDVYEGETDELGSWP